MAYSYVLYTGDGTTTIFNVTFSYLDTEHVKVAIDNIETTDFSWLDAGRIQFATAPANGTTIRIYRESSRGTPLVDFRNGTTLAEDDLDLAVGQALMVSQEAFDATDDTLAPDASQNWDGENKRFVNLADGVDDTDAATVGQLAPFAAAAEQASLDAAAARTAAQSASTAAATAQAAAETAQAEAEAAAAQAEAARDSLNLPPVEANKFLKGNGDGTGYVLRSGSQVRTDINAASATDLQTLDQAVTQGVGKMLKATKEQAEAADDTVIPSALGVKQARDAAWANRSLATHGYQVFPSGLIIQWGVAEAPGNDYSTNQNFPISFPNAALIIVGNTGTNGSGALDGNKVGADIVSNSQYRVYNDDINPRDVQWICIGY